MRLVREPGFVEPRIEEVAGAISRENSSGTIAAVRCGRETQDQQLRLRIAEAGNGAPPVVFVAESAPFFPRCFFAVRHQTRTLAAGDDLLVQDAQLGGGFHVGITVDYAGWAMFSTSPRTCKRASVAACTSSTVHPGAISRSRKPSSVTSTTARSVTTRLTQASAVSG